MYALCFYFVYDFIWILKRAKQQNFINLEFQSTAQDFSSISPNRMMLGHKINLQIDLMFSIHEDESLIDLDYVCTLQERLQRAHKSAQSVAAKVSYSVTKESV